MKKIPVYMLMFMALLALGCNIITEANGSFEEAQTSGRLQIISEEDSPNTTYRFFRFHLRQFDTTIGGTFETFDLKSYSAFNSMPKQVNDFGSISKDYYCSRIDYGYTRDNQVHIVFTDREQRQWIYRAKLGEETLHGSLSRMRFNQSVSIPMDDLDYLLAEDAKYYRDNPIKDMDILMNNQIVLSMMDNSSDRSLQCIYYYRKTGITFVIPDNLRLENLCSPSAQHCNNMRLAIIGSGPVQYPSDVLNNKELFTASLDECDINSNRTRTLFLRDNPFTSLRYSRDNRIPFIATAIIYEDLDGDGTLDQEDEKIYAALPDQLLVFYKDSTEDSDEEFAIYGLDENKRPLNTPTFSRASFGDESGWFAFSENITVESMVNEDSSQASHFYRPVQSVSRIDSNLTALRLQAIVDSKSNLGCYLSTKNNQRARCKNILPVLIQ